LLDPKDKGFVYDYGSRLAQHNQISETTKHLKDYPTTRRAILSTRKLPDDLINQHTPCLQLIDFLIRDNQLNMTAIFRSHDIKQAYVSNIYGLAKFQMKVAMDLRIQPGNLTIHSVAAHIYVD
jgi:thymidylate synthase